MEEMQQSTDNDVEKKSTTNILFHFRESFFLQQTVFWLSRFVMTSHRIRCKKNDKETYRKSLSRLPEATVAEEIKFLKEWDWLSFYMGEEENERVADIDYWILHRNVKQDKGEDIRRKNRGRI